MSDDWLPPESKRSSSRSVYLWWIGGGLFILSLVIGLSLREGEENEVPPRRRALGEVSFLFESSPILASAQQREAVHISVHRDELASRSTNARTQLNTRDTSRKDLEGRKPTLSRPIAQRAPTPSQLTLAYALCVLTSCNAHEIYMAGFDGYSFSGSINKNLRVETILQLYFESPNSLPLTSITPSMYSNLPQRSVYDLLQ